MNIKLWELRIMINVGFIVQPFVSRHHVSCVFNLLEGFSVSGDTKRYDGLRWDLISTELTPNSGSSVNLKLRH